MEKKYFDSFLISSANLMAEFGFKLKKKDQYFYQYSDKYLLKVSFATFKKEEVNYRYYIYNDDFDSVYEKIIGFTPSYGLINLLTSMAFLDWPDKGYANIIYFKDSAPWQKNAMTLLQAEKEFERLVTGHMLPWFDCYMKPVNIRNIYRNTPKKYDTKYNINFSPSFRSITGGFFEMFYEDAVLSRLLGDDMRPIQEIYDTHYKEIYTTYWSQNDSSGICQMEKESVKVQFAALPSIIGKIEAVTEKKWAEYRELTGIGII